MQDRQQRALIYNQCAPPRPDPSSHHTARPSITFPRRAARNPKPPRAAQIESRTQDLLALCNQNPEPKTSSRRATRIQNPRPPRAAQPESKTQDLLAPRNQNPEPKTSSRRATRTQNPRPPGAARSESRTQNVPDSGRLAAACSYIESLSEHKQWGHCSAYLYRILPYNMRAYNERTQMGSCAASEAPMYSASTVEKATSGCLRAR